MQCCVGLRREQCCNFILAKSPSLRGTLLHSASTSYMAPALTHFSLIQPKVMHELNLPCYVCMYPWNPIDSQRFAQYHSLTIRYNAPSCMRGNISCIFNNLTWQVWVNYTTRCNKVVFDGTSSDTPMLNKRVLKCLSTTTKGRIHV